MKTSRRSIALILILVTILSITAIFPAIAVNDNIEEEYFELAVYEIYSDRILLDFTTKIDAYYSFALVKDSIDPSLDYSDVLDNIADGTFNGFELGLEEDDYMELDVDDLDPNTTYTWYIVAFVGSELHTLYAYEYRTYKAHVPYVYPPATQVYDLSDPDDVVFSINFGLRHLAADLLYVLDEDFTDLILDADYSYTSDTLTIKDSYLYNLGLEVGDTVELLVGFFWNNDYNPNDPPYGDYINDFTITINVVDNTPMNDVYIWVKEGWGDVIADPDEDVPVGSVVEVSATPAPGWQFKKWDGDYEDEDNTSREITFSDIYSQDTSFVMPGYSAYVYAYFERIPLAITKGANQTWTKGTSKDVVIECNGVFDEFKDLLVDGVVLKDTDYKVKEGSTIITLSPSYLEKLSVGDHTVRLEYNWTENENNPVVFALTGLKIVAAGEVTVTTSTSNPYTGDTADIVKWILFSVVSIVSMICLAVFRKKQFIVR